ncbi:VWA domain-containing protein (plasmid) [Halarchaeum sp. CBA1220]|uniref:VWA domain-containing protein n=1 Tax=Halarchaeum sp. CBA1220 TaxID=1853682 RepID=UPI0015A100E7|nr:VWA domain-containing protein [Halarchaeum sp. CBA1220]QLC35724.1 VWA domain-containing protein [Halarchaeum sp. CBA1220]
MTVDVVITAGVQTAAVLPADVDAVVSSDATDIERAQAEQFLAGVDADYLVLVTGTGADLTRIPLNDQLTADHAHQFGLAFHELLHILKTAITAISELLDSEIDAQYHAQVHDLINIIEDGAIESEAIHGENFSDNAGIHLELIRRLHSQTDDDIPDGQTVRYSFWDAVTSCLYDEAIYPTGITNVLLDEDDDRVGFKTEADRDAFQAIHGELCTLSRDALAIRSADRDDTTHTHNKTASVRRARRVIQTWTDHIQPVLEADTQALERAQGQEQGESQNQGHHDDEQRPQQEPNGDARGCPESASDPDEGGDISSRNERPQNDTGDASATSSGNVETALPEDFDPSEVSLSREVTDDPHQNIFEQPQVTPDPDLDDVDPESSDSTPDDEAGDTNTERGNAGASPSESGEESSGEDRQSGDGGRQSGDDPTPTSRAQAIAQATEKAREREEAGAHPPAGSDSGAQSSRGGHSTSSSSDDQHPHEQASQLTLGTFDEKPETHTEDSSEASAPSSESDGHQESRDGGYSGVDEGRDRLGNTYSAGSTSNANDESHDVPDGPAHAQSSSRSRQEEQAAYDDALARDERAAHTEADRERIDERALKDELDGLAAHLDRRQRQHSPDDGGEENSRRSGGSGYSPESLSELEIRPITDNLAPPRAWAAIEDGADRVAATLEMYLRLDRRKSTRRGLSAGAYDTRAGHRLAIGDSRVCKSQTMGNEKQYALALILDRSGSMRSGSPPKIEVATQALARFALAAETLGIRVAIIDFIHGNARLIKPFSVETRHVQSGLLDTSCGGGTPLADAIELANDLLEAQRDDPLIISVGDDQTAADAVKDVIRRAYAPVCSLTIATDTEGTLSGSASELAQYYERQETVYTPERLDDRLDQFASLLTGL